MPRTVAVWAEAGGVGKTTFTYNIAAALTRRGKDVLVFDIDHQNATLTDWAGYSDKITSTDYTNVADRLADSDLDVRPIIKKTSEFDLVPCHADLATFERKVAGDAGAYFCLRDEIETLADDYEYFLVDAPASRGLLSDNALIGTRNVLVPMHMGHKGYKSVEGLEDTVDAIRQGFDRTPMDIDLRILGVIPNMMGRVPSMEREAKQALEERGSLLLPIEFRQRSVLEKAWHKNQSIFEYADEYGLADREGDLPEKFDRLAQIVTGEWMPDDGSDTQQAANPVVTANE